MDSKPLLSRRTVLDGLAVVTAGALGSGLAGCSKPAASACVDPAELTDAENQLRQSLSYTDQSPNKDQVCARCSFFKAAQACGHCSILSGPVSPTGHCNSWAAAAAA
jgi:hypothetical protein